LNFKFILIISFFTISCGLKTKPKSPAGTSLPSISQDYSTSIEVQDETSKNIKKK